jgi:hypothetical protein
VANVSGNIVNFNAMRITSPTAQTGKINNYTGFKKAKIHLRI